MHAESQVFLIRVGAVFKPDSVLELGSCDVNGAARILFPQVTHWLGVDIEPGEGVDVVANAATWRPEPAGSFDLVISTSTFEHTPEWPQIVETAVWHCRSQGHVAFATVMAPFPPHSARHYELQPGEYYEDVTDEDLIAVMISCGLEDLQHNTTITGDVFAIGRKP